MTLRSSCGAFSMRFGLPPILSWVDGNLPGRIDVDVESEDNGVLADDLEVPAGDNEAIDDLEVPAGDNEAIVGVDNFEVVDAVVITSFLLLSFCDFLPGTMKSAKFAPTCRHWPLSSSRNASNRLCVVTGGLGATVIDARVRNPGGAWPGCNPGGAAAGPPGI